MKLISYLRLYFILFIVLNCIAEGKSLQNIKQYVDTFTIDSVLIEKDSINKMHDNIVSDISDSVQILVKEKSQTRFVSKDLYKIALVLPFSSENYRVGSKINFSKKSENFLQYYLGMKQALEEYSGKNIFSFQVFDEEKGVYNIFNQPSFQSADIVIGGFNNSTIKDLANECSKLGKVYIAPFQSTKLSAESHNIVQLKPNLETYYRTIFEEALAPYSPQNCIIMADSKTIDRDFINYLESCKAESKSEYIKNKNLRYFYFDTTTMTLSSLFSQDSTIKDFNVIIPYYSRKNETEIFKSFKTLQPLKKLYKISVYGMPIIENLNRNFRGDFSNMNVYVGQSQFVDKLTSVYKNFETNFYDKYSFLPFEDAFLAYHLGNFVLTSIDKYGLFFHEHIVDYNEISEVTNYRFEPFRDKISGKIKYYVNNHIFFLRHNSRGNFVLD